MKLFKAVLSLLCICSCCWSFAQETELPLVANDTVSADPKYREDQFYINVTYNLLSDVPNEVNLRGFSGGLRFGFVRDMPINKSRTLAIGIGAGLGFNRYGNTLAISEDENQNTVFQVLDENTSFESNRFSVYHVEVPLEFRWRNSTPTEYKFFRIHSGLIFSYAYWNRATFVQDGTRFKLVNVEPFNPFQTEVFFLLGYNTFNVYASYNITPFFDQDAKLDQQILEFRPIKLGISFYFL